MASDAPPQQEYVLYKRRWYILVVFSMVVVCQNAFWNTFGAIEPFAVSYYGIDKAMINFLSALGPIAFIPASFVSVWIVDRFGFRKTIVGMAAMCGSGAIIRCIFIPNFKYNIAFPIIGQILNNAAGPMSMILQPKLSSIWFAPTERTLSTAIGFQANVIGLSGSYLVSMYVTKNDYVPYLLYGYALAGIAAFLLALAYFPDKPPTPPSFTGEKSSQIEDYSPMTVLKNSASSLTASTSAFILIVFGSCPAGVYSAWGSLLVEIVLPLGYDEKQAEWFGFYAMIAGGIGGVVFGKLHDLSKHYKVWLLFIFMLTLGVFVWFTLLTSHIISSTYALAMIANIAGGLLFGAPAGIILEGIVELTYPLPEQTGVNVYAVIFNLWGLFFLVAGDSFTPTMMNWTLCGSILVTVLALLPMKERYIRSEMDGSGKGYEQIQ